MFFQFCVCCEGHRGQEYAEGVPVKLELHEDLHPARGKKTVNVIYWYLVTGCMGMVQRRGFNWILGSISLLRGWPNTEANFL